MPLADIEITLTDYERAIRDTARRFAQEKMRPAGAMLDRFADPAAVIEPQSVLWDLFCTY